MPCFRFPASSRHGVTAFKDDAKLDSGDYGRPNDPRDPHELDVGDERDRIWA